MLPITTLKCPVCNEFFKPDDEVVFCPVCGAPHHKECYNKINHCYYSDTHGTDKQWKREDYEIVLCPKCGAENKASNNFCVNCSTPLKESEATQNQTSTPSAQNQYGGYNVNPNGERNDNQYGNPNGGPQGNPNGGPQGQGGAGRTPFGSFYSAYNIDPYGGVDPTSDIEGIKVSEIASFVGANSSYYIPKFKKMSDSKNPLSLNVSAGILRFLWLGYRKMLIPAFLVLIISFLCKVPDMLFYLGKMTGQAGMPTITYPLWMDKILWISSVCDIGFALFYGLLGNYLYMRRVIKKIKKTKELNLEPVEEQRVYMKKGNASINTFFIVVAAYFLITMLFSAFLTFFS